MRTKGRAVINVNYTFAKAIGIVSSTLDSFNINNDCHPLWSFNGSNLNLGFNGTTGVINTPLFGTITTKQGRRVVQLAAKFTF